MSATSTVGRLARAFGLSRSTLLYYDSIGLLRPTGRSPANYRLYTRADRRRLEQICRYREVGLGLAQIGKILDGPGGHVATALERRLDELNREMADLREQQRIIVSLLSDRDRLRRASRAMTKESWVALLRASGLDDDDMDRWHVQFERMAPGAHQDFLESLGIPPEEVSAIRRWSREKA